MIKNQLIGLTQNVLLIRAYVQISMVIKEIGIKVDWG